MKGATSTADPKEAAAKQDLEALQGTWSFVSGRRETEMVIHGHTFAVMFHNGDTYLGTFRLDPHHQPKRIDMTINDGPERHEGKTAWCIYALDGDSLRWCTTEPGAKERLKQFPDQGDHRHLNIVFNREKT